MIDLRRDASQSDMNCEVDAMGMNLFSTAFTKLTCTQMLLKRAYTVLQIQGLLADAGVPKARVETDGIGFEIWLEK